MSHIPTIRVKSNNPSHEQGFFIRNADDLKYGEELFMADEFNSLGEHEVRLKLESSPPDEYFFAEAKLWLEIKLKERESSKEDIRSACEIETLSIAKEANRLASEANNIARLEAAAAHRSARYAMYAAIVAATIMIVDNYKIISDLIFSEWL